MVVQNAYDLSLHPRLLEYIDVLRLGDWYGVGHLLYVRPGGTFLARVILCGVDSLDVRSGQRDCSLYLQRGHEVVLSSSRSIVKSVSFPFLVKNVFCLLFTPHLLP